LRKVLIEKVSDMIEQSEKKSRTNVPVAVAQVVGSWRHFGSHGSPDIRFLSYLASA